MQSNGSNHRIHDVFFFHEDSAITIGENRETYITGNAGNTWILTSFVSQNDITDFSFVDSRYGLAVGGAKTVIKTTNGGDTWIDLNSSSHTLSAIHMVNINEGWGVGTEGVILTTSDGGLTWQNQSIGTNMIDCYSFEHIVNQ